MSRRSARLWAADSISGTKSVVISSPPGSISSAARNLVSPMPAARSRIVCPGWGSIASIIQVATGIVACRNQSARLSHPCAARAHRSRGSSAMPCSLERADPAPDLHVVAITRGAPQGLGQFVAAADESGDLRSALLLQPCLAVLHEAARDPFAAAVRADGEAVHVAAPTVEGGDQGSDYLSVIRDEQRAGVGLEEGADRFGTVRRLGVAGPRFGP